MSVRQQFARVRAVTRRDFTTERSYQFRYVMMGIQFIVTAVVTFHVSKLIISPPSLAEFRGGYFDFAMIGLTVTSIAGLGVSTFNSNITREQSLGTLEVLLATPTPIGVLMAGSLVLPMVITCFDLILYLGVGVGVIGVGLNVSGVLLAIPALALTLATFCAFGIMSAGVVVLVKRGDPISGPLMQLTGILSGALFPVEVFPKPLELLARVFPAYYGINAVRESLIGSGSIRDVGPDLLVLTGFTVVLIPLSIVVLKRCLRTARRTGTLGNY